MDEQPTLQPNDDDVKNEQLLEVRLLWPIGTGGPSTYANQFAITSTGPDEYVLEFGEFLLTGLAHRTKEEIEEQLKGVLVKPVARIILTRRGLDELTKMLTKHSQRPADKPEKLTPDE